MQDPNKRLIIDNMWEYSSIAVYLLAWWMGDSFLNRHGFNVVSSIWISFLVALLPAIIYYAVLKLFRKSRK